MAEKRESPKFQWVVRIIDLSVQSEDNILEEVSGFADLSHANAFARAYVRDSVERCRIAGEDGQQTLKQWFNFGEDVEVMGAGEEGWRSAVELADFANSRATPAERDWRSLDPRRNQAGLSGNLPGLGTLPGE
ncbi:hypothetical protein [Entomobacter blattae]|uniref:Uncharacterized protein n=1 Tax=Entomobacter blattae TaxID=2762277 RepID=A0A7H1NUL2_9PROT|nr:hypothetical protein [Entomobacter blattae]QNT79472.1 hypothetical protein JGUZn3_22710 [Entomobacter blattae]